MYLINCLLMVVFYALLLMFMVYYDINGVM